MTDFTLTDLIDAMRAAAGENEDAVLDDGILDREFTELGYDSLAMMETVSRVENGLGLRLPEDLAGAATPKAFVDAVNAALAKTASVD